MSRRGLGRIVAIVTALAGFAPALAQDGATGSPPEQIDLTVPTPMRSTKEECARRRDAAIVSGEIVVCGASEMPDQRVTDREEAQRRYAEATKGGSTPDVAGPGIFRGPATVSGICIKGIFNCPKPPALIVDVTKLPEAPPGSDADRIARGLAPLGEDAAAPEGRVLSPAERAELGLPESKVSPAESAAPAAPQ